MFGAINQPTKAQKVRSKMGKGVSLESQNFHAWAKRYRDRKEADGVGKKQVYAIDLYTRHLKDIWNMKLEDVKTADIQDILDELAKWHDGKKPMSHKSLGQLKNTAKAIFNYAIESREIDYNPAQSVHVPMGTQEEPREPITEEQMRWIRETPHRAQRAAMIMLYSGLRRGEVTALTWDDVNNKNNTFYRDWETLKIRLLLNKGYKPVH